MSGVRGIAHQHNAAHRGAAVHIGKARAKQAADAGAGVGGAGLVFADGGQADLGGVRGDDRRIVHRRDVDVDGRAQRQVAAHGAVFVADRDGGGRAAVVVGRAGVLDVAGGIQVGGHSRRRAGQRQGGGATAEDGDARGSAGGQLALAGGQLDGDGVGRVLVADADGRQVHLDGFIFIHRDAGRQGAGGGGQVVGVGDVDGEGLIICPAGAVGDAHRDLVAVVGVAVGGGFKVGAGLEGQYAIGAINIEAIIVRPACDRVGFGIAAVGIGGGDGSDGCRAVFGVADGGSGTAAVAGDDRGRDNRECAGCAAGYFSGVVVGIATVLNQIACNRVGVRVVVPSAVGAHIGIVFTRGSVVVIIGLARGKVVITITVVDIVIESITLIHTNAGVGC